MRIHCLKVIISCLVITHLHGLQQEISWPKTFRRRNHRLNGQDGFLIEARDQLDCIIRCILANNYTCIGVSPRSDGKCFHFDLNTIKYSPRLRESGYIGDEVAIVPPKEGVAILLKFKESSTTAAAQKCEYYGGYLMTPEEMEVFVQRGTGRYTCGWTTDGIQRKFNLKKVILEVCDPKATCEVWCTFKS